MITTAYAAQRLALEWNGTAIAGLADNAAASPLTNLQLALHTGFPGLAGTQATSECAYGGYARVAVPRTSAGFTIAANKVSLAVQRNFPVCTSGSETALWWSLGDAATGAGVIRRMGPLGSQLGPATFAVAGNLVTLPGLTGLAVGERIMFVPVSDSALPAAVSAGVSYFVLSVSGDTVTLSATSGGSVIAFAGSGDAIAYKSVPLPITSAPATTPGLSAGQLIVEG